MTRRIIPSSSSSLPLLLVSLFLLLATVASFQPAHPFATTITSRKQQQQQQQPRESTIPLHAFTEKQKKQVLEDVSAEETTEKYGLEAGLAQAAQKGDGESAKSLLKKYGIAYLATSIPLALVSFGICYVLVENGVDVRSLLSQLGIPGAEGEAADKAGTFAIAYAAHKAASPLRFPPTVLLTPVVAKVLGKEPNAEEDNDDDDAQAP